MTYDVLDLLRIAAGNETEVSLDAHECKEILRLTDPALKRGDGGLREAFDKYADHLGTCRTNHPEHHPLCDCGFDETQAALARPAQTQGDIPLPAPIESAASFAARINESFITGKMPPHPSETQGEDET